MCTTRAQFKRALRHCKNNTDKIAADNLANKLICNGNKSFWKEINKIGNRNISMQATTIDDTTGSQQICDMWKDHYCNLLNSSQDTSSKDNVISQLSMIENDPLVQSTSDEVYDAILSLKKGKAMGPDGLSAEHLLYASPTVAVYLCFIFNAMLLHGHLPNDFMKTVLISILKDKKGLITDKDNYRPIAITCAMSKVMENLIQAKYSQYLETSCNQFGFKKGLEQIYVFLL